MKYLDRVGQEVTVGCKVAWATRRGNYAEVRQAEVTEIVVPKKGDHFYLLKTEAGKVTSKGQKEVIVYAK